MATRLTFLCAGATASSRTAAFPRADEPLDAGGVRKAAALRLRGGDALVVSSPSVAALETAAALGLEATVEPRLADLDYGAWVGRSLAGIEADDPAGLAAWLADPTGATPGGEPLAALVTRVGGWIDGCIGVAPAVLAVSHVAVLRAAIAHTLALPLGSVLRIDIAPLTLLELSHHGGWRLQELRRA